MASGEAWRLRGCQGCQSDASSIGVHTFPAVLQELEAELEGDQADQADQGTQDIKDSNFFNF
jgi:hypothetical protein